MDDICFVQNSTSKISKYVCPSLCPLQKKIKLWNTASLPRPKDFRLKCLHRLQLLCVSEQIGGKNGEGLNNEHLRFCWPSIPAYITLCRWLSEIMCKLMAVSGIIKLYQNKQLVHRFTCFRCWLAFPYLFYCTLHPAHTRAVVCEPQQEWHWATRPSGTRKPMQSKRWFIFSR